MILADATCRLRLNRQHGHLQSCAVAITERHHKTCHLRLHCQLLKFGSGSLEARRFRSTEADAKQKSKLVRIADDGISHPASLRAAYFSPSCFGERVRLYSLCQRWLSLLLPSPELSYRNWQPARRSLSIVRQTRTSHDLLADPHASAISDAIHSFDSSAHRCTQPIAFFQLHSRLLTSSVFYLPSLCHHFVSKSLHSSTFIRHQDDDYLLNNR